MRNRITDMKDVLYGGQVKSFSWLDGFSCLVADVMTKECKENSDLEQIVLDNRFSHIFKKDNLEECNNGEIEMFDRRNKLGSAGKRHS